jgi:short-subunit dehydrogenase
MPDRAALVTGASRGIGLALAEALGDEGYALTVSARKPDTLEQTAESLRAKGYEVQAFAANMADEQAIAQLVETHRDKYGRLDVLVNNAGVGIGAAAAEQVTKFVDLQIGVNLRAIVLLYRDCLEMLRAAGAEHHNAVVINLASIAGKAPSPWLSVYSATKAAVLAYTTAMNKELGADGIKSTAFAPGFVDTDMTDFVKDSVASEEMIRPTDIAEALRFLLRVSSNCVVPEIVFGRPNETI